MPRAYSILPVIGFILSLGFAGAMIAVPSPSYAKETCYSLGATQFFEDIQTCVSSVLSPQGKNSYGPENAAMFTQEAAWCEGAKGYGIGETITIRYLNPGVSEVRSVVDRLSILNGYGKSKKAFLNNGRIKTARVVLSNGFVMEVELRDHPREQDIVLPKPMDASWVELTILDVYLGKYPDTCVSGLAMILLEGSLE